MTAHRRLNLAPIPAGATAPATHSMTAPAGALPGGFAPAALALAAITLGAALQVRDGLYSPPAIALLVVTCALAVVAVLFPRAIPSRWTDAALALGLGLQLALLFTDFPGSHHHVHAWRDYLPFLAIIAAALAVAAGLLVLPRAAPVALVLFIAMYVSAGVWIVRFTREPLMDVFVFQREACAAILRGDNPYAITFPDLYGPAGEWVYGPGLLKDGRLLFGFPYMPLTLGLDLLGHLVFGDYRYALLLATAGAAALMGFRNANRRAVLCAAILLFTPRGFFIVEQGWCEPLVVFLLCATVVAAERRSRVAPILFGLLLAAKQYDLFMVPLGLMFFEPQAAGSWRSQGKFAFIVLLVALLVTMPLVLWDVPAFWHSAVMLQFRQPFRMDSLSFAALLANLDGPRVGMVVPLVAVVVAAIVCLLRIPRTPTGFAVAVAVSYLAFFALSKQAFANYYFLVIGALCCGVARGNPLTLARPNVR